MNSFERMGKVTTSATVTLGRNDMGEESTEEEFQVWSAYVNDHISNSCGFKVQVEQRSQRDFVQADHIRSTGFGSGDFLREIKMRTVLQTLWEEFIEVRSDVE